MDFDILHDNGAPKCLVGIGSMAQNMKKILGDVEQYSIEQVINQSTDWIQNHQFLIGISNVKIKKQIVAFLDQQNAHYFSLIGKQNNICSYDNIGKGTFINYCNDLLDDPTIGNHCIITAYCQMSQTVVINDFCHVSAYTYINNATLGIGNVLGLRSLIIGTGPLTTADYCNFIVNSFVKDSIPSSGTYFGNRRLTDKTSLEHQIL